MTHAAACCFSVASSATANSTGKERYTESGNDYFGARYYASSMGRFMSPDFTDDFLLPAPVPWADYANPQSLNLYAYVRNNPLSGADEDGHTVHVCTTLNGTQHCTDVDDDVYKAAQQKSSGSLNGPSLADLQNSDSHSGTLTSTSTDASGNTTTKAVGTVSWTADNPGIQGPEAMAGIRQLAQTSATVASPRGIATFYGASAAAALCVVACPAAAAIIPEAANTATLNGMAYLESQGIPATAAAAAATYFMSRQKDGGAGLVRGAIKGVQIAGQLNQIVREYRQSQGVH